MAYSLVSLGPLQTASSQNPVFGQATTAGNLLICWFTSSSSSTVPSGWFDTGVSPFAGSGTGNGHIFYKPNCGAGEAAPNLNGSWATNDAMLGEFSGGATSSPVDEAVTGSSTAASPATATAASPDAAAGELVIALSLWQATKAVTWTVTDTFNNGVTLAGAQDTGLGAGAGFAGFSWGITTGNASADALTSTTSVMSISAGQCALVSFLLPSLMSPQFKFNPVPFYPGPKSPSFNR